MRMPVRIAVAILACYGAAFLGTLFMTADTWVWYSSLDKPSFQPPSWLFGPVWTILYAMMATALVLVWKRDPNAKEWRGWVPLFFAHLLLNAAWTIYFFGYHAPFIALIDILLLDVAVILLMCGAWEIDRRATYLLSPYLAWLLFATLLNASIWYLN